MASPDIQPPIDAEFQTHAEVERFCLGVLDAATKQCGEGIAAIMGFKNKNPNAVLRQQYDAFADARGINRPVGFVKDNIAAVRQEFVAHFMGLIRNAEKVLREAIPGITYYAQTDPNYAKGRGQRGGKSFRRGRRL